MTPFHVDFEIGLFVRYILFLLFAIRSSDQSKLMQIGKWIQNDISNNLKCLETFIGSANWVIDELTVISDDMDILEGYLFERFSNHVWRVYSVRERNLNEYSNGVIFSKDFDSLNETLNLVNIKQMDTRGKYVISIRRNFASVNEIRTASKGFPAKMWDLDKVHVVFLVPCRKDVLAMTYYPFFDNCRVSELQVMDVCEGDHFEKGVDSYPEKMFNLNGCVQNHSLSFVNEMRLEAHLEKTASGKATMGGVGGNLIQIIAEKMNITLNLLPEQTINWTVHAEQIARGETFCAVAGVIPIASYLESLTMESGFMEVSFGLGYKTRGYEVSWKNLLWPLSKVVWTLTGCSLLIFCGLIILLNRFEWVRGKSDRLRVFDAIGIFLGNARVLPTSLFGRYVIGMWAIYSYLMSVTYDTELVSFLTTPMEKHVIKTFGELLEDGMPFGGNDFHRQFYNDPSDPTMMKIYNKFEVWPFLEYKKLIDGSRGPRATGLFTTTVNFHNVLNADNITNQLRMLNDRAFTYHAPITMRRGSPLAAGVRHYASLAIQSGLVDYWINHYSPKISPSKTRRETPSVLTVEHYRGLSYLHAAGLIFSSFVFLGEIIHKKHFSDSVSR